jgi:anti-sigma factor RsiW
MNDCDRFRDALLDLVDGTLAPADLAAARAHERSCEACASLAGAVRTQSALLSRLPRPAPPADLGARIERALGARSVVRRPRRWMAWTAAAAALLLAVAGVAGTLRGSAPERSVRVVDVELPDRGSFLGRYSPSVENPGANLLDPLVTNE